MRMFTDAQVLAHLSGDRAALDQALRMALLVRAGGGRLRFLHLLLRDHLAYHHAYEAAHSVNPADRDRAAWALWQISDSRSRDLLVSMLNDPDPYARGSAIGALGRVGDLTTIAALEPLLDDSTRVISLYGSSIADVAQWAIQRITRTAEGDD